MSNTKKYSIGITSSKAIIHTEDIDTAKRILDKLFVPTLINVDNEHAVDIRSIKNVIITIQLEGDIQRIKLKDWKSGPERGG